MFVDNGTGCDDVLNGNAIADHVICGDRELSFVNKKVSFAFWSFKLL